MKPSLRGCLVILKIVERSIQASEVWRGGNQLRHWHSKSLEDRWRRLGDVTMGSSTVHPMKARSFPCKQADYIGLDGMGRCVVRICLIAKDECSILLGEILLAMTLRDYARAQPNIMSNSSLTANSYVDAFASTHAHTHAYTFTYTYAHAYTRNHACTHTYTHTHTCTDAHTYKLYSNRGSRSNLQ